MNLKKTLPLLIIGVALMWNCQGNQKHTADFDKLQRSLVTPDSSFIQNEAAEVLVYYFHATRRCATCQAVESTTKEALKEYYGDKIVFESINRDEDKENPLIAKYKVSGQTLLIIKGNKVINLTNEAFMNARTNPNKFKAKLKATVDPLL